MKVLRVDILLRPLANFNNENFNTFFNLLDFIKKVEKIAITFVNKLFSYFHFTIGKILPNATCNNINFDFFAYIAIDQ